MSLEEHFYLLWPLTVFALSTTRRLITAAVLLLVAAVGLRFLALRHQWPLGDIYTMTPFRIDTLLAGALLAIAWRTPRVAARLTRYAPIAFVLAAGLAIIGARSGRAFRWDSAVMAGGGYDLIALVFVCLLAMALTPGSITARALTMSWLRFLGKYSYGIYPVYLPLSDASNRFREWIHHLSGNHPLDFLMSNAAIMTLAIGVAMASYHLIEQPFLRLKPRLAA